MQANNYYNNDYCTRKSFSSSLLGLSRYTTCCNYMYIYAYTCIYNILYIHMYLEDLKEKDDHFMLRYHASLNIMNLVIAVIGLHKFDIIFLFLLYMFSQGCTLYWYISTTKRKIIVSCKAAIFYVVFPCGKLVLSCRVVNNYYIN